MKESIAHTIRPCVACGRPGYHVRKEVAPCYKPTCGTCAAWSRIVEELHACEQIHNRGYFTHVMNVLLRVLVRGAEREGRAHQLTLRKVGDLAQFVASFGPATSQ